MCSRMGSTKCQTDSPPAARGCIKHCTAQAIVQRPFFYTFPGQTIPAQSHRLVRARDLHRQRPGKTVSPYQACTILDRLLCDSSLFLSWHRQAPPFPNHTMHLSSDFHVQILYMCPYSSALATLSSGIYFQN